MKTEQLKQIIKHGENLNVIFNTGLEPLELCKKLRRLENKAHKLAVDYCNGKNGVNSENWEQKTNVILKQVYKTLNVGKYINIPIFINGDARGYALKISDTLMRQYALQLYRDMGGYGIISAEFN